MLLASTLAVILLSAPAPTETSSLSVSALKLGGVSGFFVPRAVFIDLELAAEQAPLLRELAEVRKAEAAARAEEAHQLRQALVLQVSATAQLSEGIEAAGRAVVVADEGEAAAIESAETSKRWAWVLGGVAAAELVALVVLGLVVSAR